MFTEDLIAEIVLNFVRLGIVIVAGLITAVRSRQRGRLDLVPAIVAVVLSFVLGFAQPWLSDFIYLTFIR